MPLYQIQREVPGWTDADLDAAAIRTQTCAAWFDGMEWLRSFHDSDSGRLLCYYLAESPGDLERHAKVAEVPCDLITEVHEVLPSRPAEREQPEKASRASSG